jgi:hypothetical protein
MSQTIGIFATFPTNDRKEHVIILATLSIVYRTEYSAFLATLPNKGRKKREINH